MSRHERTGALVVLAVIAVVITMIWAVKECSSPPPQSLKQELVEWEQATDSVRQRAAQRDSMRQAGKSSRHSGSSRKSKDDKTTRNAKPKKAKPPKQKRNTPSQPSGLPDAIPNY